jgi:hypothetical protein
MTPAQTVCPSCRIPLDGGPVVFWCSACRHDVHGSVLDVSHMVEVTSKTGQRINPLTLGSAAFRTCYGRADLDDRLSAVAADLDLELSVCEVTS